jgi:cell fate (sporulation/competence/biofilm development) regulator YlbF (YheA/YmcA/DUF963 family)
MDEPLLKLSFKLKEALDGDIRVIALLKAENELENSQEAQILSYRKDSASTKYNDMIRIFGKDSLEAQKAQKELFKAKKELDELLVVRNYLDKYKEVRILYDEINEKLFSVDELNICEVHHK